MESLQFRRVCIQNKFILWTFFLYICHVCKWKLIENIMLEKGQQSVNIFKVVLHNRVGYFGTNNHEKTSLWRVFDVSKGPMCIWGAEPPEKNFGVYGMVWKTCQRSERAPKKKRWITRSSSKIVIFEKFTWFWTFSYLSFLHTT